MSFRHPELLWILAALLPYSFTALGFLRSLGRYCKTDVLRLNQPVPERIRRGYLATRAMAAVFGAAFWVLAVLAAADPLAAGERVSTAQGSYQSIAVVLDVSNSMLSSYGGVTRLEAAKKLIRSIQASAPGARWTLVAFKGASVTLCPPTSDPYAFGDALSWADPGLSDAPGSDLGTGILRAVAANQRGLDVLFVFTDGNDTGAKLSDAAKACVHIGAKVMLFGMGDEKPVPVVDLEGRPILGVDGKPVSLGLLSAPLVQLAAASRGRYLRADDPLAYSDAVSLVAPMAQRVSQRELQSGIRSVLSLSALIALGFSYLCSRPPYSRRARALAVRRGGRT